MSIINKRTTPVEEDEGLIKHVVFSPLIDLHTSANTDFTGTGLKQEKTIDQDSYSGPAGTPPSTPPPIGTCGWGMRKIIPDNVRVYDLTHDNSNINGRQGITRINFEGDVEDKIGSNDGTWTGGAAYKTSIRGQCGDFIGTNYVKLANESAFDRETNQEFTVSLWFNTNMNGNDGTLFSKEASIGVATGGYSIWQWSGDDLIRFRIVNDTSGYWEIYAPAGLNDGKWHHIVCTKGATANRSAMKIYIDGTLSTTGISSTITGSMLNNAQATIGAFEDGGAKFTGQIDEVEIFNVELDATEVSNIYRNTRGITFQPPGNYQTDKTTTATSNGVRHMGGGFTDGASYMVINDHTWLDVTDEIMINGWFYLKDTSGGDNLGLVHKQGSTAWALNIIHPNILRFVVTIGGSTYNLDYTYTANQWIQVLAQAKSGTQELWVNNTLEDSDTQTGAIGTNSNNLGIFATASGAAFAHNGTGISWLSIANGFGDATWVSDYFTKGQLNYDTDAAQPEEITTIPFIGSVQEMPNSFVGMFVAT